MSKFTWEEQRDGLLIDLAASLSREDVLSKQLAECQRERDEAKFSQVAFDEVVRIGKCVSEQLAAVTAERDELVAALTRAERKLSAYVGVCTGDKELTGTVLPMARAALAKVGADKTGETV